MQVSRGSKLEASLLVQPKSLVFSLYTVGTKTQNIQVTLNLGSQALLASSTTGQLCWQWCIQISLVISMVYRFTGGTHRLIYLCKKEKKCISQNVLLFLEKTWIPNWGKWPTAAPPKLNTSGSLCDVLWLPPWEWITGWWNKNEKVSKLLQSTSDSINILRKTNI